MWMCMYVYVQTCTVFQVYVHARARVYKIPCQCTCICAKISRAHVQLITCVCVEYICTNGVLLLVGSIKLQVSFAEEPCKRDIFLQKRPVILSILLTVAIEYAIDYMRMYTISIQYVVCCIFLILFLMYRIHLHMCNWLHEDVYNTLSSDYICMFTIQSQWHMHVNNIYICIQYF